MRNAFYAAMMLLAGATPCLAAQSSVNSFTPSEEAKARTAISQAGYTPGVLQSSQDGNFFVSATKGNELYTVTATPDGQVFASTGLPLRGTSNPAG